MPTSVTGPARGSHAQVLLSGTRNKGARGSNGLVPAARAQGSGAGIAAAAAPGAAAGAEAGTAASKGSPVRPEILSLMPRGAPRALSMSLFRPAQDARRLKAHDAQRHEAAPRSLRVWPHTCQPVRDSGC